MMKKAITVITLVLTLGVVLTSCSILGQISGKYINENNDEIYLKFDKNKSVSLYRGKQAIAHGTYERKDNFVAVLFLSGGTTGTVPFILHDGDKSISIVGDTSSIDPTYFSDTFNKEKGFWAKHWLKVVIGFLAFGAIITLIEKITGRDIDEIGDQVGEAIDNFFDRN